MGDDRHLSEGEQQNPDSRDSRHTGSQRNHLTKTSERGWARELWGGRVPPTKGE